MNIAAENEDTIVRGRKRKQQPEKYKRNIIKNARVSGKEFVNWSGRYVAPRGRGPYCGCKKRCCYEVTSNKNIEILNVMKTKDEQDIYLQGLIKSVPVKRKRARKDDAKKRCSTYQYFVIQDEVKPRVSPEIPSRLAYNTNSVQINDEKLEDLKKLLKYIPTEHKAFYENVIDGPTTTTEDIEHLDIE